jgi:hypothetical protein
MTFETEAVEGNIWMYNTGQGDKRKMNIKQLHDFSI